MNENEKNNNTKNVIPPDSAQQTMGTAPDKELTTLLADDWDIGCDSMLTMEKKNSNPEDQARAEKLITSLARASGEHARPELALRKLVAPSAPTPPSVAKPPAARPPVAAPPPPPPPPARRRHIDSQHESPASVVPGKAIPLPPVSREEPTGKRKKRTTESDIEVVSDRNRQSKRILISDETADFPTSTNPFKQSQNIDGALKDVAAAESTSASTLKWLSDNADPEVRQAVASNPKTAEAVLKKLSKDPIGSIRLALLDNPDIMPRLIVDLLNDSNPLVSLRAHDVLDRHRKAAGLEPLKRPSNTVKDLPGLKGGEKDGNIPITADEAAEVIEFLKMIARRHSTPTHRLCELASHPSVLVRQAVAQNAKAPIDVLWSLAHDRDPRVKAELIRNTSCPPEVLEVLQHDKNQTVADYARAELTRFDSPG